MKKEIETPATSAQTTAVSSKEKPAKKAKKARWTFRIIVLILIAIIGTGIYRNLQMKKEEQAKIPANALFVAKKLPPKVVPPVLPEVTEALPTPEEIKDQTSEEKIIAEIEADKHTDSVLEKEIQKTLESKEKIPTFTALDALAFRDHFLSEAPCGEDFRKLILSDRKSKVIQKVIKETSTFCLGTDNVYIDLKISFKTAKKKALVTFYKQENTTWKAHLKATFAYIIKIRNLNPTEDTMEDRLDRAHNALEAKNIALTVETLSTLPENLQVFFKDFLNKTKNYIEAKTALDELVLSYAKGAE